MTADPVAIARDLVRCRSVTPEDGGALAYLQSVLAKAGFDVHRMTFAESGTAPIENLYARIGSEKPNLVFAGHTDVVPPGDEAAWQHPPFAGDEESVAVNGTVKLLQWAAERGEKFDHCILGEPSNVEALGDTIKAGRRGSLNGTLIVTGRQGHVAYPDRADNPIR